MAHTNHESAAAFPPRPSPHRRKAVLVCSRCGYVDTVDGDWVVTVRPDADELHCPVCHELLTRRRQFDDR